MKKLTVVMAACGLALCAGCVTTKVEERLPPVQKLESWKQPFRAWSKGVEFPVTVVVVPPERSGFLAYGVDPDHRKIHFVAEGSAEEHLRDIPGDPIFGTVVVIEGKALAVVEPKEAARREDLPVSRVQVAVDVVRAAYLPQATAQASRK